MLELYPHRTRQGSKFTSGTVVVAGGGRGLTGAPAMAALAAQRAGAGYVQVAVPASAELALSLRLLEAMTRALPESPDGMHVPDGVDEVLEMAERAGAVVLGPGLGRTDGARRFALDLAQRVEVPLLVDADGLNAHAGALESLRGRAAPTVLTPHSGELGRLLERDSKEIDAARLAERPPGRRPQWRRGGAQGRRHDRRGARRAGGHQPGRPRPRSPRPAPATCCRA